MISAELQQGTDWLAHVVGRPLQVRPPHIDPTHATVPADCPPTSGPSDGAPVSGIVEAAKSIEAVRDLFGLRRQLVPREILHHIERVLRFEGTTIYSAASNERPIVEARRRRSKFQMIRRALLRSKADSSSLAEYQR